MEVYFEDDDETETFKIVTSVRGSSLNGKISIESPIGKALMKHRAGDRVYCESERQRGLLCGDPLRGKDGRGGWGRDPEILRRVQTWIRRYWKW